MEQMTTYTLETADEARVRDGLGLRRGRELSLGLRGGGGRQVSEGRRERLVLSHRLDDGALDGLGLQRDVSKSRE